MLCKYTNRALRFGASVLGGLLLWGCSTAENLESDQRTAIEKYISSNDIEYTLQSGVYVQTLNADREDYSTSKVVAKGDRIVVNFALFEFTSGFGGLFYTNVKSIVGANSGLNTQYWDFTPKELTLGAIDLVRGLDLGLIDKRVGDSVHLFMPAVLGYGTEYNGVIPSNTPLVWAVKIIEVK